MIAQKKISDLRFFNTNNLDVRNSLLERERERERERESSLLVYIYKNYSFGWNLISMCRDVVCNVSTFVLKSR
jgi:hypothetical protein